MRLLALVLCLTMFLPAQSHTAPPKNLLFTNVNVVDTYEGVVHPRMVKAIDSRYP